MLPVVPDAEVRLVGTASSVLRGIEVSAADIDILFRERHGVDEWFNALDANQAVQSPRWLPDAEQYLARLEINGVSVELSTVEIEADHDTAECFGLGPWHHFDLVRCSGGSIPAVATELRLLTEFARRREDRYRPIMAFLRETGCDLELITRGLERLQVGAEATSAVIANLRG